MTESEVRTSSGGVVHGGGGDEGGGGHGPNGNGHGGAAESAQMLRLLTWLGLVSLAMGLGSLAFIYLHQALDRLADRSFTPPSFMWVSTALILVSSGAYIQATASARRDNAVALGKWLFVSLALGGLFLVSQAMVWSSLVRQGVYATTYPLSGMFYIMTIAHAIHMLGGLGWLGVVTKRAMDGKYSAANRLGVELCGLYWHFLTVVWLVYFVVLMAVH
jgi:cytochrome c oxidase subunit 3